MARIVLYGTVVMMSGLLGANVYNSVVDAPNWGAFIPQSIEVARRYFAVADPGTFYRVASPIAQVLALAAVVVCWKRPSVRWCAVGALALALAGDALTFTYFYPRNALMFEGAIDPAAASRAWREWIVMNHVRSLFVAVAITVELTALSRWERLTRQ